MPHDKNGKPLSAGTIVTLLCAVTAVHEGETACNIQLQPVERPEGEEYIPDISLNSKFCEIHEPETDEQKEKRKLERFQQRVVDEKAALDEKLVRLEAFVSEKGGTFSTLKSAEQARLTRQLEAMRSYSATLGDRIDGFGADA